MEIEKLQKAIKQVAWGYVLLHFDLNLGTMDIMPNWCSYLLFISALNTISETVPAAKLLRPFGVILTVWESFSWCTKLVGATASLGIISLMVTVVNLYFHFQLLTNIAEIATLYNCPQTGRIITLRTVRTVMTTFFMLPLPWAEYELMLWMIVIEQLIVAIWICSVMFSLRRSLAEVTAAAHDDIPTET